MSARSLLINTLKSLGLLKLPLDRAPALSAPAVAVPWASGTALRGLQSCRVNDRDVNFRDVDHTQWFKIPAFHAVEISGRMDDGQWYKEWVGPFKIDTWALLPQFEGDKPRFRIPCKGAHL